VENGVNINKENDCGETPLFNACRSGNVAVVKYLLKHKVKINKKTYLKKNFSRLTEKMKGI